MSLPRRVEKPRVKMPHKPKRSTHDLSWTGVTYTRVPPGIYDAVGTGIQGPQWCLAYSRWSLRIEFALLAEEGNVSRFFNMGSEPDPHIGSRSLYFQWWTVANGELPRRGQKMSADVFLDGQVFRIGVEDALMNGEQQAKHNAEVYSRVVTLHGVSRP